MKIELQETLFSITQDASIDNGAVVDCASLIAKSVFQLFAVGNMEIWLGRRDAALHPIYHSNARSYDKPASWMVSHAPAYFNSMIQSNTQFFNHPHEVPDSEVLTGHLCIDVTQRSLHVLSAENDIIALIICEFPDTTSGVSAELTTFISSLIKQFHRCATAKQLSDYTVLLHDIKDQMVKSESMSMLGNMVASITHEINNPLGVAITGISHLKSEVDNLVSSFNSGSLTEEVFQEFVDECKEACSLLEFNLARSVSLIKDFKKTAVDQEAQERVTFDICDCVKCLATSLQPEIKKHGVDIDIRLPTPVYTLGYPGALSQIMTNLCFNSIKHAYENVAKPEIHIYGQLNSESKIFTLVYEDNGNGIPKEIQGSVFAVFFTTKRGQGGSGLGMAIAKKLAREKLAGDIEIDTSYHDGARFLITIPIAC